MKPSNKVCLFSFSQSAVGSHLQICSLRATVQVLLPGQGQISRVWACHVQMMVSGSGSSTEDDRKSKLQFNAKCQRGRAASCRPDEGESVKSVSSFRRELLKFKTYNWREVGCSRDRSYHDFLFSRDCLEKFLVNLLLFS